MKLLFALMMDPEMIVILSLYVVGGIAAMVLCYTLLGIRYIPNNAVGIVEKLWSPAGSIAEGRMIVIGQEAGYRAAVLRGGFYFLYWIWQYRIHKVPLTIIPQGKIGYIFARDGEPRWMDALKPSLCGKKIASFAEPKRYIRSRMSPNRCRRTNSRRCPNVYSLPG